MMILQNQGLFEAQMEAGLRLAETPEAEGGWKEYFSESDAGDLRIKDDVLRAHTALMLENAKRWMATKCRKSLDAKGRFTIDEATRSATVGGFADYIFPIIRAAFPTNPINDLVSVQPTTRRVATVVYWNWVIGKTKGSYYQGQRLFDANTGWQDGGQNYSNEVISGEPITALGGANATITGTLSYVDGGGVRPGTVRLSLVTTGSGTIVVADNGAGAFVQASGTAVTISASSINYATGAWSITLGGLETFTTASTNTSTYRWDSEGSANLPEVDVQITTTSAETERRALKINYSQEAMQDIMAELGTSLEPSLVQGAAETINVETARQIIAEIWGSTPATAPFSFNIKTPSGISQQEHFRDFVYTLNQASNGIWAATQKGYGNWGVVDSGMANLVESLPSTVFERAPAPGSVHGLHFIGTLAGQYRIYKDLHLDKLPGSSATGNMLVGYKGSQFFEAGYVWAPYQLLYSTQPTTLADFMTQRGLASRYATKMVNEKMFTRIGLTNT
jgi:Major capsid protein Gp23